MDESMDLSDFLGELSINKRISSISEDSLDDGPVSKLMSFKSAKGLSHTSPPYTGRSHTSKSLSKTSPAHTSRMSPVYTSTSKSITSKKTSLVCSSSRDIPRGKFKQRNQKNNFLVSSFDEKYLKKNDHKFCEKEEKGNTQDDDDLHKQVSNDDRVHNGLHNQFTNFEEKDNLDVQNDEPDSNRKIGTRPKKEKIKADKKKLTSPTMSLESTTSVSWPTFSNVKLSRKDTEWLEDSATKVCMSPHCQSKFTLTLRKHHCRSCGKIFCRHCCRLDRTRGFRLCLVCNPISTLVKAPSAHW